MDKIEREENFTGVTYFCNINFNLRDSFWISFNDKKLLKTDFDIFSKLLHPFEAESPFAYTSWAPHLVVVW